MEPITLFISALNEHGCKVISNQDVKGLGNYCYIVVNPDGCEALMQYHPFDQVADLYENYHATIKNIRKKG